MAYGLTAKPSSTNDWDTLGSSWKKPTASYNPNQYAIADPNMRYGSEGFNANTNMPGLSVPTDTSGLFGSLGSYANGSAQPSSMWGDVKSWWGENKDTLMGDKNTPGLIPMGVGLGTNIMNTYMGMQNYGLAKQTAQDGRDRYASDFAMQSKTLEYEMAKREASKAGAGGMTRAEAEAYGEQRAKEIMKA